MALPIKFPEANFVLLGGPADKYRTPEDVLDLHTFKTDTEQISCWRLSWRERLSALVFGKAWIHVVTPRSAPPIGMQIRRTIFSPRHR